MDADWLREMRRMESQLQALEELVEALGPPGARPPERAEGSDPAQAVWATVDADGLPVSFRVDPQWRRRVGLSAFAGAVARACTAAREQRSMLSGDGAGEPAEVERRLARFAERLEQAGSDGTGAADSLDPVSRAEVEESLAAAGIPVPDRRPRPLDELFEDVLALGSRAGVEPQGSGEATAPAAGGRLSLTISPAGEVFCTVDIEWLSRRDAEELTDALNRALGTARAGRAAAAWDGDGTSRLIGDLVAGLLKPDGIR